MFFTQKEIFKLNDVIQKINSFQNEAELDKYLKDSVEDAELLLSTLRSINKNKLVKPKKKKEYIRKNENYTCEKIIEIFKENDLNTIVTEFSKQDLTDMYLAFYSSKPLTSYDKVKIAQNIYQYIYKSNRTKALLAARQE